MTFALTPYDTSKERLNIKANNFEEWEEKTKELPFEEYEVAELGDYFWIKAEQGTMEAFFEACEHFEDGVDQTCYKTDLLREAIQQLISSNPRPADILAIKWENVDILEMGDLIEQLSDAYDVENMGFLKGYIDWDSVLRDLTMSGDYTSFVDYSSRALPGIYYVRGL